MNKRRLYFGCAISGLPREHYEEMVGFRSGLAGHFMVQDFCDPQLYTDAEVYHNDIHHAVRHAKLMLAFCDERSTGLGYELGTMIERHGKPVLALAREGVRVSKLIAGISHPRFEFCRYTSLDEVLPLLLDFERRHFSFSGRVRDFLLSLVWKLRVRGHTPT